MPKLIKAVCLSALLAFSVVTVKNAHAAETLLEVNIEGHHHNLIITGGGNEPKYRAGQFTLEELDAMHKRAQAQAAKVKASKL